MKYHDIKNNSDISLAIALKSSQLQRISNVNVESDHVLKTLLQTKWNDTIPNNLNDIIKDIIDLDIEEIVAFLSSNVIIEGSKMQFNEFKDLIGGN